MARNLRMLHSVPFIIFSLLNINSTIAQFPNFKIQANDSLPTVGDTAVIKCLVYDVTFIDIRNSYNITWFKDSVKLTQRNTKLVNDVITDKRYSISTGYQGNGIASTMQITDIIKEDRGYFSCEVTNKMNAKKRKSIYLRVEDPEDDDIAANNDQSGLEGGGILVVLAVTTYMFAMAVIPILVHKYRSRRSILNSKSGSRKKSRRHPYNDANDTTFLNEYENGPGECSHENQDTLPEVSQNYKNLKIVSNQEPKFTRKSQRHPYEDANDTTFLSEYDNGPGECRHENQDTLPEVSQNYKNLEPLSNQEPKFTRKSRRHPYEDANDTTFISEYENGKIVGVQISNAKINNDLADIGEQVELSAEHRKSSDQDLLRDSDQYSLDGKYATKTKKVTNYEQCHNVDFLQEFEECAEK